MSRLFSHYWGVGFAILATAVVAMLKVVDWLYAADAQGSHSSSEWAMAYLVSVTLMVIANIGSIHSQRQSKRAQVEAEGLYNSVKEGLRPIVRTTLQEKIETETEQIRLKYPALGLQFYAFARVESAWRVLASTQPRTSQTWNLSLIEGEGVTGFTAEHRADFLTKIDTNGDGLIFDKHNNQLGGPQSLSTDNRARFDNGVCYIFSAPFLVEAVGSSLTQSMVGVFTVDAYDSSGDQMMTDIKMRTEILRIGGQLAPYLGVLEEMNRVEAKAST